MIRSVRAYLASLGYAVVVREQGWVECLLVREDERWFGQGLDEDDALRDALGKALPSHAARSAFERAAGTLAAEGIVDDRVDGGTAANVESAPAGPPAELLLHATGDATAVGHEVEVADSDTASDVRETTELVSGLHATVVDADPRADADGEAPCAASVSSGIVEDCAALDVERPENVAPMAQECIVDEAPPSPGFALEAIAELRAVIAADRDELGLCTPQRQRLVLLGWMARARAYQEAVDDHAVYNAVASMARAVNALAKEWWPGSVPALVLGARPADALRTVTNHRGTPTNWDEVADIAEQAVRELEDDDERCGLDAYGWADGGRLSPAPVRPDQLLERIASEVSFFFPLGPQQPDRSAAPPAPGQVLEWVRRVRWLRGAVDDDRAWAAVAGRLRHWTSTRSADNFGAAQELDPAYAPARPWADLLRREEQAEAEAEKRRAAAEEERRREVEFAQLMTGVPVAPADGDTLYGWLARALPFTDIHQAEVAAAMLPFAEQVFSLDAAQIPDADRRIRRRLEKLKKDLRSPGDVRVPMLQAAAVPQEPPAPSLRPPKYVDTNRTEVVARTRGRAAAFVGNRRDEDLRSSLIETLELARLDWFEAEPRRIDALAEAVRGGAFAFVLSATGFLDHTVDRKLVAACGRSDTRYVRVNRGRPAACVRALARELGIGAEREANQGRAARPVADAAPAALPGLSPC